MVRNPATPLERLFRATLSADDVDAFLRAAIALLVEVGEMDAGVLRVGDERGLRSRASVGLDDEIDSGFASPSEPASAGATVTRIPMDDARVSDAMRQAGMQAALWLNLPGTPALAACLVSRSASEVSAERAEFLGMLASHAASSARRLLALDAQQQSLREREQSLADIAHDLKNSLHSVALSAGILNQRLELTSPHRAAVERIARHVRRASVVVESLLSSSVIEAGKLVVRRNAMEPAELVLAVAEAHQDAGLAGGVVITTDLTPGLPQVWGDDDRIFEVFDNLVGNALKFTPASGAITVGAAPKDDHVLFWVKDTGSGMAAEDVRRMFERYFRAKSGARKGSGLGLNICKGIVEAHGGRIWAESTEGVGTTVFFTLPLVEALPASDPTTLVNVLIVDDRPLNLQALEAILEGQGYRILKAQSGQEALRTALEEEFSVILLDIEMPEMNGFEIAAHLKLTKRTKSIPIIFVTAHGEDPEQVYRAYTAGGADYLVKPLDPEIVRRKVAVFAELGRRRAPRQGGTLRPR